MLGASLASRDLAQLDSQLRLLCGSLIASPSFLLGGIAAADQRDTPRLTAPDDGYAAACTRLAQQLATGDGATAVSCTAR